MTKRKIRTLIILAACFMLALLVAILPYKSSVDTKAYDLTLSVFSSRKMELEEGARLAETSSYSDTRKGMRVTGKSGSYVGMKETVAGKFDMNWIPENGISAVTYTFENTASKESFDLVIQFVGETLSSYVECNGEKAGLYYFGTKGLSNLTQLYNNIDTYTENTNEYGALTVSFDPETMSVKVKDRLVWSFLSDYSDGRKVSFAFDSFETYTVKMTFSDVKANASAIIYDINGQNLENTLMLPDAAPRIFAKFGYDGVVGQKYTLPQANVYDLLDGIIPASECEVKVFYAGDPITLENGAFTPTKTGKYQIDYTAENEAEFATTQTYMLNVNNAYGGEMVFGGKLPEAEVGAHTQLSFPAVEYVNGNISALSEIPVSAEILKDGTSVKVIEDARNGFTYTPSEAGSYEVVYKPVHIYYGEDEYTVGISVSADKIGYTLGGTLQSEYTTLDKVTIPSMTMHTPDGDLEATWKIQFPNGGLYQNQSVKTTEAGTYNIIYTASNGENTYEIVRSFDVLVAPECLLTGEGSVSMQKGTYSHIKNVNGLVVETQSGGKLTYNNVIRLDEYNYFQNKDEALLCELYVDPYKAFNADFVNLEFVLTDLYDPDNYVTIVLSSLWEQTNQAWSVLRAGHGGGATVGLEGTVLSATDHTPTSDSNVHTNTAGFLFNSSISATPNTTASKALTSTKIYFDYETKSVLSYSDFGGRYMVADLDHDAYFSEHWAGFTTGECTLTIQPKSYVNSTARFVLLNVDGHDFTTTAFRDEKAPKLVVNTTVANGDTTIPDGVVGKKYPLFNAVAVDDINGVVDVQTRVYYRYAHNYFDINVADGGFMPEYAGEYLVVYTATDLSGNESEYSFTVTVHEETYYESNQMYATLTSGYQTNTMAGNLVEVAKVENCGGGVGRVSYSVSVSGPDGASVALENGVFRPTVSGTYTVNYTLTDYVKTQFVQSYEIEVAPHNGVIFFTEEIRLPLALLNGIEYELPQMRALDYASGSAVEKVATLTVKDQDGNALQPQNGVLAVTDSAVTAVTLTYACPDTEAVKEYTLEVRQTLDEDKLYNFENYFYANTDTDTEVAQGDRAITLKTSTQGERVEFLKAVLADKLALELNVNAELANLNAFSVIFTDEKNPNIAVKFTVTKNGDGARVTLNNGEATDITGSFTGVSNYRFTFKYNASNKMFKDAMSKSIGAVKTCLNGEEFNGFTSGAVNIAIVFEELTGEAELDVYTVNNQTFIKTARRDGRAPEISFEATVSNIQELNATVTVPHFYAIDVLGNVDLFVSVQYKETNSFLTDANGNSLNNVPYQRGISFVASEVGEYVIILTARDYMRTDGDIRYQNSDPIQVRFTVRDDVDPTIELNGKLPTSAKVGKVISLPTATVSDNGSADDLRLMVFWISPDNVTTYISEENGAYKFTPKTAGTYTVKYVVMDKYFNYAEIVGTIEVK